VTLDALREKKRQREPIVMVTAYDPPSADAAERAGVDLILVGDTAAMTVLGYRSTVAVDLDDMLVLAGSAARARPSSVSSYTWRAAGGASSRTSSSVQRSAGDVERACERAVLLVPGARLGLWN